MTIYKRIHNNKKNKQKAIYHNKIISILIITNINNSHNIEIKIIKIIIIHIVIIIIMHRYYKHQDL